MFCRNCGLPLPEDAKFCPKCGAPTVPQTTTLPGRPKTDVGLRNKVIIAAAPEKHYVTSAAEQGKTSKRDYRIWVDFFINLFYLKTIYDSTITQMAKEPRYGTYYP